jgi:hypothetical protein
VDWFSNEAIHKSLGASHPLSFWLIRPTVLEVNPRPSLASCWMWGRTFSRRRLPEFRRLGHKNLLKRPLLKKRSNSRLCPRKNDSLASRTEKLKNILSLSVLLRSPNLYHYRTSISILRSFFIASSILRYPARTLGVLRRCCRSQFIIVSSLTELRSGTWATNLAVGGLVNQTRQPISLTGLLV